MTTIDKSKLKRIITQCGSEDEMDIIRAIWSAAQAEEREECARIADSVNNYDNPMTAQDVADSIRQK